MSEPENNERTHQEGNRGYHGSRRPSGSGRPQGNREHRGGRSFDGKREGRGGRSFEGEREGGKREGRGPRKQERPQGRLSGDRGRGFGRGDNGSGRDGNRRPFGHKPARREHAPREKRPQGNREQLPEFFATCAFGFEDVLAAELRALRVRAVRPLQGGVSFRGKPQDAYRVCMWTRCASRVLLVIDRVDAYDADELYESIKAIPWEEHLTPERTIAVFARGTSSTLRNTTFTGMKVKDAVCDRLREACGDRPNVDAHDPDVAIWVNLHRDRATVNIDFAGGSLHRRGYRQDGVQVVAPLKEALAAAILLQGGWDKEFAGRSLFIDPMCGSGTFVIEAAMIAADRAPGLLRDKWGFQGWKGYVPEEFDAILEEADERLERGLAREDLPLFVGCDLDPRCIEIARESARSVGLAKLMRFEVADCENLGTTVEALGPFEKPGFVAINPPYGMRLMPEQMDEVNEKLRRGLNALPEGWRLVSITPDATFDATICMDATSSATVYNGRIETTVRTYELGTSRLEPLEVIDLAGDAQTVYVSSGHAEQFAARLRKVAKLRRKWAAREDVHAYRVYDADLPDYAVAIDLIEGMPIPDPVKEQREFDARRNNGRTQQHGGARGNQGRPQRAHVHAKTVSASQVLRGMETFLVVSEYQAPKDIDKNKAARRFEDACKVAATILGIPQENVCTRVRKQDKGGAQYSRERHEGRHVLTVEGGHVFELDLKGYLDTGLFLDHRPVRAMIEQRAEGKRFLNLFAYTGSVSVYAAAGGATSCATVDLSATYLEWARRNMQRNDFRTPDYRFSRSDSMRWLDNAAEADEAYDLIFIDPPTFSNSKAMGERTWDIQRDHVELIDKATNVLAPGGTIIFSGNLRSFKLDVAALEEMGLVCVDITAQTIPEDFQRNQKIHFCFEISRK